MKASIPMVFLAVPGLAWAGGVTVTQGWMRYLLPSLPAAGYFTVTNRGTAPAVLTGAASPACGALMLHESKDDSGMASMMDVPAVTIPAGERVDFAPGGYHLMCMQPRMKVGEKIIVTLAFAAGPSVSAPMPVYGASDGP